MIVGLDHGHDVRSLTGVLVVAAQDYLRTDGFDETFEGWGAEDIEFRLRLHVVHGLRYADIPLPMLRAIPHAEQLRTEFYKEKDIRKSSKANNAQLLAKILPWEQEHPNRVLTAKRLFFQGPLPADLDSLALEGSPLE